MLTILVDCVVPYLLIMAIGSIEDHLRNIYIIDHSLMDSSQVVTSLTFEVLHLSSATYIRLPSIRLLYIVKGNDIVAEIPPETSFELILEGCDIRLATKSALENPSNSISLAERCNKVAVE